jgi:ribosomal protein S18 acetylase RimI-like enzyme
VTPGDAAPAVALRPEAPGDRAFLRELYGSTRELEMGVMPWSEDEKRAFLDLQFHAQDVYYHENYTDTDFLVIEVDGERAGRLYIQRAEDAIYVVDIALLPAHRGRGIGRRMMDEIVGEGRAQGKKVSIYVEYYNPARRLYDRLGFRALDTNGVYLRMVWEPQAAAAPR